MAIIKNNLTLTEDGSHTVNSGKFGVTYHSKYGAINESQVVFIDAGLKYLVEKGLSDVSIFEMGFGTGLNALMALQYSKRLNIPIDYHTIEAYPIEIELVNQLNYIESLNNKQDSSSLVSSDDFKKMHLAKNEEIIRLTEHFCFTKAIAKIETHPISIDRYDCIFFDAFAPTSQEELWTQEIMEKIHLSLRNGGVLVSYCAKGVFKRTLKAAGYTVESIAGPPGKREMTRAHKK